MPTTTAKRSASKLVSLPDSKAAIYKKEATRDILGVTLRYIPPDIVQLAKYRHFLTIGLQDLVGSPEQVAKLPYNELRDRCMELLNQAQDEGTPAEQRAEILGEVFLNAEANEVLLDLFGDCFPDVDLVRLNQAARDAMFQIISEDIQRIGE